MDSYEKKHYIYLHHNTLNMCYICYILSKCVYICNEMKSSMSLFGANSNIVN